MSCESQDDSNKSKDNTLELEVVTSVVPSAVRKYGAQFPQDVEYKRVNNASVQAVVQGIITRIIQDTTKETINR